jgi:uncharacterized membrane protein
MMNVKMAQQLTKTAPRSQYVDTREWEELPPLYHVTTALCVFMVSWILIFPASAFQEHSAWRRQLFDIVVKVDSSTPPEIVKKYAGQYMVQATHILPGAIWAALIPFQLHPGARQKYRRLHRWCGYVFFTAALVMASGVWFILHRQLGFEHFFVDLPPSKVASAEPGLLLLTAYFVATVGGAVYAVTQGRIADHQRYVIRHIAAGIWIAVQRVLLIMIFPLIKLGGPFTRQEQRTNFAVSGAMAMAISVLAGEYVIYNLQRQQQQRHCVGPRQKRVD